MAIKVQSEDLFNYLSTKFNLPENASILSITLIPDECASINYECLMVEMY